MSKNLNWFKKLVLYLFDCNCMERKDHLKLLDSLFFSEAYIFYLIGFTDTDSLQIIHPESVFSQINVKSIFSNLPLNSISLFTITIDVFSFAFAFKKSIVSAYGVDPYFCL